MKLHETLKLVTFAIVPLSALAETVTYTAGDTSLANDKITFGYDVSGDITTMRMRTDDNETLVLTGAALSFADGAHLIAGQNTNVVENACAASGSLMFGITNLVSSDSNISKTAYTTLFQNMRLDDISPVSAVIASSANAVEGQPYSVHRGDGMLTVEFQVVDNSYVKCAQLELRQDGDNIVGKVTGGGHFGRNNTSYLGWNMFDCPTLEVTSYGYNVKQLEVGSRRETYDYTNGLLTASFDTIVARNVAVEDLEILFGAGGYKQSLGSAFGRSPLVPRHVKLEDGILSAQMVYVQSASRSKCVKIELKQSGNDVVARAVYAKYNSTNDETFDFDVAGTSYTLATDYSINGYGVDMLALRRKSKDRIVFKVSGSKTLGAVSGNGTEVTFEASAAATVTASGANTMTDSAYVIKGTSNANMNFTCSVANALPWDGTTDVYGEGTKLTLSASQSKDAITMHPGSELICGANLTSLFAKKIALDAATLNMSKYAYVNELTLTNASTVNGATLRVGYTIGAGEWQIGGTGVSTCNAKVNLYGNGASNERWLTIAVADTVAGEGSDFIVSGDIATADRRYPYTSFVKTGVGTMRMDGSMVTLTNLPVRIVEGTLAITTSNAIDADKGKFSLEGGTLSFAAGTANTVSDVTLTETSAISVGAGAALTMKSLTVPDGAMLAITGDVLNGNVKVTTAPDDATLSRIRLNGKRVARSADGRLHTRGFIVSFY